MKLWSVLLTFAVLLVLTSQALVAFAIPAPGLIYGHVIYNGSGVNGVTVSLSGAESKTATTDGNGYYQFGVTQGNTYTVSASYNGHSASRTVTTTSDQMEIALDVTGQQSSGGSSSGGTFTYSNPQISTPTPTVTAGPTPTPAPSVTPTPTPTPIPTPSATPSTEQGGFPWWLIALLVAIIAIAGAAYFLFMRKS